MFFLDRLGNRERWFTEEEDAVSYIESIKDVEFTSNLNLSPVLAVSALSLIPVEMFGDT